MVLTALSNLALSSRDPPYVTPAIKSMLRSKNKLLKKGRLEQAEAITTRIGVAITKACEGRLGGLNSNSKNGSKLMWEKVREITGKGRQAQVNGVDPVSLNGTMPPLPLTCSVCLASSVG